MKYQFSSAYCSTKFENKKGKGPNINVLNIIISFLKKEVFEIFNSLRLLIIGVGTSSMIFFLRKNKISIDIKKKIFRELLYLIKQIPSILKDNLIKIFKLLSNPSLEFNKS